MQWTFPWLPWLPFDPSHQGHDFLTSYNILLEASQSVYHHRYSSTRELKFAVSDRLAATQVIID
jgi:hypothetical protein